MPGKKGTSLTEAHINAICKVISAGCPMKVAATVAGIDRRTLYEWRRYARRKGKENDLHRELVVRMEKAQATAIARNVAIIQKSADKNWTAAAWYLERRHPELFARVGERRELEELKSELEGIRREFARHADAGKEDKKTPAKRGKRRT